MACPLSVLLDAEWVTIPFLLDSSSRQQRGTSVHLRELEQCLEYSPMNSVWEEPVVCFEAFWLLASSPV
jgi:hypothetical protein